MPWILQGSQKDEKLMSQVRDEEVSKILGLTVTKSIRDTSSAAKVDLEKKERQTFLSRTSDDDASWYKKSASLNASIMDQMDRETNLNYKISKGHHSSVPLIHY